MGQDRLKSAAEEFDADNPIVAATYYFEAGDLFFAINDFERALFAFNKAAETFGLLQCCEEEALLAQAKVSEVVKAMQEGAL
jgi:tetratricopeptide (TPR) repeat protein